MKTFITTNFSTHSLRLVKEESQLLAIEGGVAEMGDPVAGVDVAASGGEGEVDGEVAVAEDKVIEVALL